MAVLDPRLLPLIETLAGSGADWLAFEILEGVRRGREPFEPEELLQAAREKVRSRRLSDRLPADIPALSEPIVGDDQIVWAANYIATRLDSVLAELEQGCAMIEAVAENSGDPLWQDGLAVSTLPGGPLEFVLIGQESHPVDRRSLAVAKEGVVPLREALARWSLETRDSVNR